MRPMNAIFAGTILGVCACGSAPTTDSEQGLDLETATVIAALEANADGTEIEDADATGDAPLLMHGCDLGEIRHELMGRFDRNGDRHLRGRERPKLGGDFGAPRGDVERPDGGFEPPTAGEGEPGHPAREARLSGMKERFDADADGTLDEHEHAAMAAEASARCESRKARLTAEFDVDGDGELGAEEWEAAHAAVRDRFAAEHEKLVEKFDRDGDGALRGRECDHARRDIADKLGERRGKPAGSADDERERPPSDDEGPEFGRADAGAGDFGGRDFEGEE